MKARKDKGKCEACGLPIWKGDEYIDVADEDDWMETKRGKRVIPGRSFFRLHVVCADMVSDDRVEIPAEPRDVLENLIISVWFSNYQGSLNFLNGKKWIETVAADPPTHTFDPDFHKQLEDWRSFYIKRYYDNIMKPLIDFWMSIRNTPLVQRIIQREGEHEWRTDSLTKKDD